MSSSDIVRQTDIPVSVNEQIELAKAFAPSNLLPRHLQGRADNILVVLAGGRALSIPAFTAMQSMHVVDGKLGMAAELMRALAIRAGHRVRVSEDREHQSATVTIIRKDDPDYVASSTFTWDDAKTAELTGKTNWKRYRPAMLVARATSAAIRTHCPEVLFGCVYTPEELGAEVNEDGSPVIDGEIVEPVAPVTPGQPSVDWIESRVSMIVTDTMPIIDAGKAFHELTVEVPLDLQVSATFPGKTFTELWHDRIIVALRDVVTKEACTAIWQAAAGTGVLNDVPRPDGPSLRDRIIATVKEIESGARQKGASTEGEAVEILRQGGLEGEIVERATYPDDAEAIRREAQESWGGE